METKFGRFTVQDEPDKSDEIQGLQAQTDSKGMVDVGWVWPSAIRIAVVFELDAEQPETPDVKDLLSEQARYSFVTKETDQRYSGTLSADRKRYAVFPAKFGEGDRIIVLNQRKNNVTPHLYKEVHVRCNIRVKPLFASPYKRVLMEIISPEPICFEKMVFLSKLQNGKRICRYPAEKERSSFYIKKEEEIRLEVADEWKPKIKVCAWEKV